MALEEQYLTRVMERKRNAKRGEGVGWGAIMPKLLSKVAPCYKCYRVSCLVTI